LVQSYRHVPGSAASVEINAGLVSEFLDEQIDNLANYEVALLGKMDMGTVLKRPIFSK